MKDEVTPIAHISPEQLRKALSRFVDYHQRECCRRTMRNAETTGTGTSEVLLDSLPDLSPGR